MKSFINKLLGNTSLFEVFILAFPFALWIFCFLPFLTGHLSLEADATSYADHIGFYTDNLSRGVYPLWDPDWFFGAPYSFFLRRIGDLNPFFMLIVLFKWLGVSSSVTYLIFITLYYFLAGLALYLITKFLLVDRFYAFIVYILFLFSSWGSEVFYNYIIIIFVPMVWFFYFLLSFSRNPKKGSFLGMFFCLGLILTTYIPFLFLTILAIFTSFYVLFYRKNLLIFLKSGLVFIQKNKFFVVACTILISMIMVPPLIFYHESKSGEFVLPGRHSGADVSSAVAVGLDNAANGDIISHGYFDRIFDDHADIDMGDIYLPFIFFLLVMTTLCARVNKLIFFLFFNILGASLITITSTAGVHRFLYEHVIFFKFIRQIYYFFWLSMLPMSILLVVVAFKELLTGISNSSKKMNWLGYIIVCHVLFFLFLWGHKGVLTGAWISVALSLVYFLFYFCFNSKVSYRSGFLIFLLAVFVQSFQVYEYMDKKLNQTQIDAKYFAQQHKDYKKSKLGLYYTCHWFQVLIDYVDPVVLENYTNEKFILYDNVVPYVDSPFFFKSFESTISSNENIAYVPKMDTEAADWQIDQNAPKNAEIQPIASGKLSVVRSDANTWVLNAHLTSRQFLVLNDNYNSDWHAFVNDHETRLFRANVAFKGLWLPPGDSKVTLRFSTPSRYVFQIFLIMLFMGEFLYLLILLKFEKDPQAYV